MPIARWEDILEFWFTREPRMWFTRDPAFDAELNARFGDTHAAASRGELDDWARSPRSALALVIVLDQLSRNLYRDDPRAFASDARALTVARELVRSGHVFPPIERMFLIVPFEHAEELATQREGVAEFERLAADAPDHPMMAVGLDYARKHAAVIERFGRFPHRNAVLGRPSTPEELAFLEQPGSRF